MAIDANVKNQDFAPKQILLPLAQYETMLHFLSTTALRAVKEITPEHTLIMF